MHFSFPLGRWHCWVGDRAMDTSNPHRVFFGGPDLTCRNKSNMEKAFALKRDQAPLKILVHYESFISASDSATLMKKCSERRKHCALAVVMWSQKFSPGGARWSKFNQLEMVTTFTYRPAVWWKSMHAISSYRGNRHHPPATNTQTHRQDRLQYTAPLASAQCNY